MRRFLFITCAALLSCSCGGSPKPAAPPPQAVEVPAAEDEVASAEEPGGGCGEPDSAEPIAAKAPAGYLEMTVAGVADTEGGPAVVLVDPARTLGVPVFIGGSEALSIQLRLRGQKYTRPLTHDLLDQMMGKLGGRIVNVRVDRIENNVFIGAVVLQRGKKVMELDSRVSDAIALALGNRVPIYVARSVIEKSGVELDKLGIETA